MAQTIEEGVSMRQKILLVAVIMFLGFWASTRIVAGQKVTVPGANVAQKETIPAKAEGTLMVGAAVLDIAPSSDLFPFGFNNAYAGPGYGGVIHAIKVRAIAISNGNKKALFMSHGLSSAPDITGLAEHLGVPKENIMYLGTHTHSSAMFSRDGTYKDAKTKQIMDDYKKQVMGKIFEAADKAMASMKPARMGIGTGKSFVNVNRDQEFVATDPDGTTTNSWGIGTNYEGISDKTLSVTRFDDLQGKPIAFLINYPVHATIMSNSTKFANGGPGMSSDLPGITSQLMEGKFGDAVAIWTSGAAGDQNPVYMGLSFSADPKTGAPRVVPNAEDSALMAENLSAIHYLDILRVNETIRTTTDKIDIGGAMKDCVVPAKKAITKDNKVVGYEDGGSYTIPMQFIRIGDVAYVGLMGELYTSLGMDLKAISPYKNTVIVTHDQMEGKRSAGYIMDDQGIAHKEHGYRGDVMQGVIKPNLENTMKSMIDTILK
jgi:neutral ceramidase